MTCPTISVFPLIVLTASAALQNPLRTPQLSTSPSPNLEIDPFQPFLSKLSPQARQQYNDIMDNDSLTPNQIEQQLQEWARKNNVLNEFNKYQKQQKTFLDNLNMNIRKDVGNLVNVLQKLTQILDNKDQSIRMQRQAIEQLTKQYPDEVTVLFLLSQLAIRKSLPTSGFGSESTQPWNNHRSTRSFSTQSWNHPTTTRSNYISTQSWSHPTTSRSFPTFPWIHGSSTPSTPTTRRFPPFPTSQRPWF